ncbi:uncharacterized protein LOC117328488 [Pecten maximus]|uniref:uncharacterized protein LOC117328488 n=1 Tax=Pecten maximus TaxID=6579 RepID=UPI0014586A14|nr:uncharacterized protein LOC117328488 [Pecten maximus]
MITPEQVNEFRVRNYIKDRMQKYRNKRKEERQRLLEERKARWIERQKRLGVYVEPSESASTCSGSSMSGLTEEERQIKRETRRKLHKLIPLNTVVDELKKNLELETHMRGDFLETIRIIRGIKKEDFYRQDTPEIYEEEEEEKEEEDNAEKEEEEPPVEEETVNEDAETPRKKTNYKDTKPRTSSRWPKGHRHHTKAVKSDWSFLTHYSDAELTVELAYLLPVYMRDVERFRKARGQRWTSTTPFKTKRIQRNLEFESWREEMMRIAYDEEFGRGKPKMFTAVPLPKIKETASVVNTSRSSRVTLFDATEGAELDDNWSPRGPNASSLTGPNTSPYQYNPRQNSVRQQEQTKKMSRNRNSMYINQHKSVSKIYRPVGRRVLVNNTNKIVKTTDGNTHKQPGNSSTRKTNGVGTNTKRKRNKSKDNDLGSTSGHSSLGDNSVGSTVSTSDHISQNSDQTEVTTITVHFNTDHSDTQKSGQVRTRLIKIPSGGTDLNDRKFVLRINSPLNRDGKVTKLFDDIQQFRGKHPDVDQIKIQLRSDDVEDIKWVCQYVENQSQSKYKAEV